MKNKKKMWLQNEYYIMKGIKEHFLKIGFNHDEAYELMDYYQERGRELFKITDKDVKKYYKPITIEEM